jgi:hypothetical protein
MIADILSFTLKVANQDDAPAFYTENTWLRETCRCLNGRHALVDSSTA